MLIWGMHTINRFVGKWGNKKMSFKEKIQHKYALSEQGAKDMIKAFVSVTISDIVLMFPVGMLYFLVKDYMGGTLGGRGGFYLAGSLICLALIAITTYIQYNATFFCNLCGEWCQTHHTRGKTEKNTTLVLWTKKICRI